MPAREIPLEVVAFSKANALQAETIGAQRIELNAAGSYDVGGLTPSVDDLRALHLPSNPVDKKLNIPVRIMIRPRPAPGPTEAEQQDFIYSDDEFEAMKASITEFKNIGTLNPFRGDAFVFGILERVGPGAAPKERELGVDIRRCTMLVEHAKPVRCVFHRAFDVLAACDDWRISLSELIRCGFTGVLTSGGPGNFTDNIERLTRMCYLMPDIQIIVGGGVRSNNAQIFTSRVKHLARLNLWMHSSCRYSEPRDGQDPEDVDTDELRRLGSALGHGDVE